MQYKNVTPNIMKIYFKAIGAKPIAIPSGVNGTKIPIIINKIEDILSALCALLCINGVFAVLIMCIPIRFDTIL